MNCIEFRRAVLADPLASEPPLAQHARECGACAAFLQGQLRLTQQLKSAMRVAPPSSLADRIIFAHIARPMRSRRLGSALAATLAFITFALGLVVYQPVSLANEVARHLEAERLEQDRPDGRAAAEFPQLVAQLGGVARAAPPPLLQAAFCETDGKRPGLHLVLADGSHTVTIFVLPHDAPRVRVPIHAGALHGWLLPRGGVGLAVLSEADIDPEKYAQLMDATIAWPRA